MTELHPRSPDPDLPRPTGWCCSYCADPLQVHSHGLYCPREERWFATQGGVHRLLTEERRREIQPGLEQYQRVRRDEGWRAQPGLPEVPAGHPHAAVWQARAERFQRGVGLVRARLGQGPWMVLEVGAGCCWASARLAAEGHHVAAVDVNLDPDDGLPAADLLLPPRRRVDRAEAEMEALPCEPAQFDLVLAAGSLHHAAAVSRTLVELRRVTRRGGLLLVLDSPVYRREVDGEAMVEERRRRHAARYGESLSRAWPSRFFVLGQLPSLFREAGWRLDLVGWPGLLREAGRDLVELARYRRRTARFPILIGRRDG
jgi:SAM-dependent methyltransferase